MTSQVMEAPVSATTMRVAVMAGVRDISIQDLAMPEPGPGQVLVRVRATAICTWEQRSYSGAQHNKFPFVGGHEIAGEVAAIGPGTSTDLEVGERVAVGSASCGHCHWCMTGQDRACKGHYGFAQKYGDAWGPGGFAEYRIQVADGVFDRYPVDEGAPCQGEAVGMEPGRGEADHGIPRAHRRRVGKAPSIDQSHGEPGHLDLAGAIHIGHFRRLASEQRTAGFPARRGDTTQRRLEADGIEPPRRQVIEEEEGTSSQREEVVHVHGDQISTQTLVVGGVGGKEHLGADAVTGGGDQWIFHAGGGAGPDQPGESGGMLHDGAVMGRPDDRRDRRHESLGGGDVDAGRFVRQRRVHNGYFPVMQPMQKSPLPVARRRPATER